MISTDFSAPRFVERAKTVTVSMPLYESGREVSPVSSGTYTLYDGNGTSMFTGAVTVPSGVATRVILSTDIPAATALSDRWLEEWVLTMVDGRVETVRRDVYLCLRTLYPPVNERMLERRISDLQNLRASTRADFSDYIVEAWAEVETRLIQAGKRPYLITNAWALRPLHMALCIKYIMQDASTYMGDGGRYEQRSKEAGEEADTAWDSLQLEYDDTESGERGNATTASGPAVIYTNRPPLWSRTGWVT